MRFGFLTDKTIVNCKEFTISPLDDFDQILESFYENVKVSKGWIYGRENRLEQSNKEKQRFTERGPFVCDRFYRITPTHEIGTKITDEYHLRFLVLAYGFLQGLYLTPEGYSYLGPTPYEPGTLNGLLLTKNDHVSGMQLINSFFKKSSKKEIDQMFACIHWFSIGQSLDYEWDRFDAQYKVLDGLFRISGLNAKNHASRPVVLANKYKIQLPDWAETDPSGKASQLSRQRNELVHEAKYGGHPIGYAYPQENYSLEFSAFNLKLIAATLGIDTPYLKADPKNRLRWGWEIRT